MGWRLGSTLAALSLCRQLLLLLQDNYIIVSAKLRHCYRNWLTSLLNVL